MVAMNVSERRPTDQRQETLDLAYECRRLSIVSNRLLREGLDDMDEDTLKQSVHLLNKGINDLAQKGGFNLPDVISPSVAAPKDYLP